VDAGIVGFQYPVVFNLKRVGAGDVGLGGPDVAWPKGDIPGSSQFVVVPLMMVLRLLRPPVVGLKSKVTIPLLATHSVELTSVRVT